MKLRLLHIFFLALITFAGKEAAAQYRVKGGVYDSSGLYPIEAVTVWSSGGRVTRTDSAGRYQIEVGEKDSLWFSYQGRSTPKYAVSGIADVNQFNIALRIKVHMMPEVRIRTRSYIYDSLENRRNYARIFDYEKPGLGTMTSVGPMGAGIDINELIRLFQFRRNKAMLKFQQRLLAEEREKFVDRRFNRLLVKTLTGLDGDELAEFMQGYRPPFEFAANAGEYEFRYYIKTAAEEFRRSKNLQGQNRKP